MKKPFTSTTQKVACWPLWLQTRRTLRFFGRDDERRIGQADPRQISAGKMVWLFFKLLNGVACKYYRHCAWINKNQTGALEPLTGYR